MSKKITTVLGEIKPEDLGFTSMHEHVLADMTLLVREVTSFKGRIPTHMLKFNMENMAALRQGLSLFSDDCSLVGDINFAVTAVWLK